MKKSSQGSTHNRNKLAPTNQNGPSTIEASMSDSIAVNKTVSGDLKDQLEQFLSGVRTPENVALVNSFASMSDEALRKFIQQNISERRAAGLLTKSAVVVDEVNPLYPLAEAEKLIYPNLSCAVFDYYATGEGRSMGMLIVNAFSPEGFRAEIEHEWGEYYAHDVYVRNWSGVPKGFELLYSAGIDDLIGRFKSRTPMFRYATKLHFNLA